MKHLQPEHDTKMITDKMHHHRGYEIHITKNGWQCYEVCGKKYNIEKGHFLIIAPEDEHKILECGKDTEKISLFFIYGENRGVSYSGKLSDRMLDNIKYIISENESRTVYSNKLIENRVMELVMLFLRDSGMKEAKEQKNLFVEDARVALARQYIRDNIVKNIKVSDIACYCYLSTKQLTRLFLKYEGISPAGYIHKQKILYIEKLIENKNFSLREISEKMNFSSEYYFNSFFKKHYGMPPGVYRNTMK